MYSSRYVCIYEAIRMVKLTNDPYHVRKYVCIRLDRWNGDETLERRGLTWEAEQSSETLNVSTENSRHNYG